MNHQNKSIIQIALVASENPSCTQLKVKAEVKNRKQDSDLKRILDGSLIEAEKAPTYKVLCAPQSIGHPHGMTEAEVRLVQDAERHICDLNSCIFYAVLSDADLGETEFRQAVRSYLNRIVQIQRRAGIPPTYIAVFEGTPQLHVNILFPLRVADKIKAISRLSNSKHFGADGISVKPAKCDGWFTRYTAKERTHADRFIPNIPLCKRRPGHHPLGKLGGERVRLSKHLESQIIIQGRIAPRKKTNAKKN